MRSKLALFMLVCVLFSMAVVIAQAAEEKAAPADPFRYGGDVRVRYELTDKIPAGDSAAVSDERSYFRFRWRLWGEVDPMENVTLKLRITEEFRYYVYPENTDQYNGYRWPDEVVVDSLYADFKKLAGDKLDIRVGRQDLVYGNNMIFGDGTPKDGSRTYYSDAVKFSFKGIEKTTVDLLGIYNQPENDLAFINEQDRDLTGQGRGFNDITESGAGFYAKNSTVEMMPLEAYYIFKNETDWDSGSGTNIVNNPEADIHTIGLRLMPKFNDMVSGNLEVAYQMGERGDADTGAEAADFYVTMKLPEETLKPTLDLGIYYLSGDDPDSEDYEGWDPLWARHPQRSEMLGALMPNVYWWSNLIQYRSVLGMTISEMVSAKAGISYVMAAEDAGPGEGDVRGWLYQIKTDFALGEKLVLPKDKLAACLIFELLDTDDYYTSEDDAIFLRGELSYLF